MRAKKKRAGKRFTAKQSAELNAKFEAAVKQGTFVIVQGWQHNDHGDDIFFERGFCLAEGKTLEQFKDWFKTQIKGPVKNDWVAREVTRQEWERIFKFKEVK